jgi:hypothetical protein
MSYNCESCGMPLAGMETCDCPLGQAAFYGQAAEAGYEQGKRETLLLLGTRYRTSPDYGLPQEAYDYLQGFKDGFVKGTKDSLKLVADAINLRPTPPVIIPQVKAPASGTMGGFEWVSAEEASRRLYRQRGTIKELLKQLDELQAGTSRTVEQDGAKSDPREYDHSDPWEEAW